MGQLAEEPVVIAQVCPHCKSPFKPDSEIGVHVEMFATCYLCEFEIKPEVPGRKYELTTKMKERRALSAAESRKRTVWLPE
tara:strand:+ start:603 stop:845 length:243 start_codon:yes stop_codon:yes gene_type:complete